MQWCHLLVEQHAHPGTWESPGSAECSHLPTAMLQFPAHLHIYSIFIHKDKLLTNITKANFDLIMKDYE
jgi:hypothetical protein